MLKNANSATVSNLVRLLNEAIAELIGGGLAAFTAASVKKKRLYFHICILERRIALHCQLDIDSQKRPSLSLPVCSVKHGSYEITDGAGMWAISKPGGAPS